MMHAFARITSDDEVRDRLTNALETNIGLLDTIVVACAGWTEHLDSRTWNVTEIARTYREVPPWLPVKAIRAQATRFLDVQDGLDDRELMEALLQRALGDV
ncbi:hypothetical protein CH256_16935 [Rhodococcus sp. 05-2254-6]|nr:hypothetical protein CH256_16935 [Rhodococcus sp. 05-2254-6]